MKLLFLGACQLAFQVLDMTRMSLNIIVASRSNRFIGYEEKQFRFKKSVRLSFAMSNFNLIMS
jgi:hypothetical protein